MAPQLKLFALSTCIHCRNTKKFLDENNVPYDCVFVDQLQGEERQKTLDEVKRYNAACSFPTIVLDGEKVIVGFRREELMEALGL